MVTKDMQVKDLRPYENNPRINNGAVDAVAESIREFGFKVPLVVDKDNVIVAGHTRWKAAKKLGLKTVPVVVADDLTPEQIKAYRLADNKTGELAEWDLDLLDLELGEIEMDMEPFGFEQIEDLFGYIQSDDFAELDPNKTSFGFTIQIPVSHKKSFELYVKNNGKSKFQELLIKEVMKNA